MVEDFIKNVARNVRVERAKQDITIAQLAQKSGVNIATISFIENAKKPSIRFSTLFKIAKALNVEVEDLVK